MLAISGDLYYFLLFYCIISAYIVIYLAFLPQLIDLGRYGDFSYAIYIYNVPVLQLFSLRANTSFASYFIMSFATVLLLSILSWHLIEKQALKLKKKLLRKLEDS